MTGPLSVVIDTDPGLDDALALFIACASPEFDVLGVTTVAGNVGLDNVTRNALRILDFAGRADVPVIAGADRPLRRPPIEAGGIHGGDGLGGLPLPNSSRTAATGAADWMATLLRQRPSGSVRLLALGPLTNIAALIEAAPDAAAHIGEVIAMGGAVRDRGNVTPFAEFNIHADPEAADIVLRSGVALTLIPLDLTRQVAADPAWGARLAAAGGKAAAISAQLVDAYLANIARYRAARGDAGPPQTTFPLHDPCVMLHLIDRTLFAGETLPLSIPCAGARDGATVIDAREGRPARILFVAEAPRALALAHRRIASLT
ncbi:MAG: hypothetical protein BGP06_15825 [Rhizobiales bacterium 65-9]|nr:nucleoside hydrolase [Hyphomicrobiales bacterium]OJY37949.1 MAG: hypothetical protein BGP06_15825 [Rhizobiales bacterium 65-9]